MLCGNTHVKSTKEKKKKRKILQAMREVYIPKPLAQCAKILAS